MSIVLRTALERCRVRAVVVALILVAAAAPAAATVHLTGRSTVPGQPGEFEYDIQVEEMLRSGQFRVIIRLRGYQTSTHDKTPTRNFYMCPVLQLSENARPHANAPPPPALVKRGELSTCCCRVANPSVVRDETRWDEANIESTCWCCRPGRDEPPDPRPSYHLGCKRIDLNRNVAEDPSDPGYEEKYEGWQRLWTEIVSFSDLQVREEDIAHLYWDLFVDVSDVAPPRKWIDACATEEDCKHHRELQRELEATHAEWIKKHWTEDRQPPPPEDPDDLPDVLAPEGNTCPPVVGHNRALRPHAGWEKDPVFHATGRANGWVGVFHEVGTVPRVGKVPAFGYLGLARRKGTERAWRLVRDVPAAIRHKGDPCEGRTSRCWLATTPLGNAWTRPAAGQAPVRLRGKFTATPGAAISIVVDGQADERFVVLEGGAVNIDVELALEAGRAGEIHYVVALPASTLDGAVFRFEGRVFGADGNPVWKADQAIHHISVAGEVEAIQPTPKPKLGVVVVPKIGYSMGLAGDDPNQLALGVDTIYPFTKDRRAAVVAPLSFQTGDRQRRVMVAAGMQYDFPLGDKLVLYPRASLGFAHTWSADINRSTTSALVLIEAGFRFQLPEPRFVTVGIEPIGFELLVLGKTGVAYRPMATVAATF